MRNHRYGVFVWIGAMAFCWQQAPIARSDEKPAESAKSAPAPDLSKFPTVKGKVEPVLGNFGNFTPPKGGESFHLDLKEVLKLRTLSFNALPGNIAAVQAATCVPLPGPVVVESIHYHADGSFLCMSLVSKYGSSSVTLDVAPAPDRGPKRVLVWVTARSKHGVVAVALVDCECEGAFPGRPRH
jgi:hypothetical protein